MNRFYNIIIFILLLSYTFATAQNIKVEYRVKAKQSLNYSAFTEPFLLLIDARHAKSLFISKNKLRSSKIFAEYFDRKMANGNRKIEMAASDPEIQEVDKYKNKFQVVIEKDFQSHNFNYQQHAFMSSLQYQSELPKLQWHLKEATKNMMGYLLHKAILQYKGRHYTAWYAPKVSVSDGPFKFWGLPGLIFEIYDDKDDYHFTLTGIEFPDKINFPEKYFFKGSSLVTVIKTTEKKFQKDFEKTFSPDNVTGTIAYIGKNSEEMVAKRVEKFKSKYNNPIELSNE